MSTVGGITTNQQLLATLDPAAQEKLTAALQQSFSPGQASQILGALTQVVGNPKGGLIDGRTAPQGAPSLELPAMDFSSDEMMIALQGMNAKVSEGQLATAKNAVELSGSQRKTANDEAMKKLQEAAEKSKKAAEAGIFGKIFNWIKSIAMAVVGVALMATVGLANPMLLPVLAQMTVGAVMDLVNLARAEMGKEPIKFNGLFNEMFMAIGKACGMDDKAAKVFGDVATAVFLTVSSAGVSALATPEIYGKGLESVLIAAGVPEDKAKIAGMALTIAVQLAATIAMMCIPGGQVAALNAVGGAFRAIGMGVDTAAKVASAVMKTVVAVQAGIQIAQGATQIAQSVYTKQADDARIDAKEIQKLTAKIQAAMEDNMEKIKELMKELEDGNQMISQMLASSSQARSQQIRNIV